MDKIAVSEIVRLLELKALEPEGGYFKQTNKSRETVNILVNGRQVSRSLFTSILYLITTDNFSHLHKLQFGETFHFYGGDPVTFVQLDSNGNPDMKILGPNFAKGHIPQLFVAGGTWQGCKIETPSLGWALLGTTMSPGFEFEDFQMANTANVPHFSRLPDIVKRLIKK